MGQCRVTSHGQCAAVHSAYLWRRGEPYTVSERCMRTEHFLLPRRMDAGVCDEYMGMWWACVGAQAPVFMSGVGSGGMLMNGCGGPENGRMRHYVVMVACMHGNEAAVELT
eukprot:75475-Chlamydomonas_euryale.AAC.1